MTNANPCERPGKLYRAKCSKSVWTHADEGAFLKIALQSLCLANLMAVWTRQRQRDLLRLTRSAYDGTHIRLRQSKTHRRVVIPIATPLRTALDAVENSETAETIHGASLTSQGFSASWRKAVDKAQIVGLTFHDLRGTAVTHLAIAGCFEAEIATITEHSMKDVGAILDEHYLSRDSELAESAIKKLKMSENSGNIPK
uniref:tyrosine-type recombinase/integrase n=1 Tax=Ruegeria arenilitoris TaxID=1173585 RepID=UPI001C2C8CDD|nr:tyrosine-type recombinase/integrase [Ruegeria arenilitoris]